MAWHKKKATSHCIEQWRPCLLTYICIDRPQWEWGRVTHICVSTLTIMGSDNGLSPGRRQAIIWTNAGILLIGPLGTNFREILIKIYKFSFKKMHLKTSSGKWRPSCLGLNVLTNIHAPNSTVTAKNITPTINTLRPKENGRHFADDIFLNENVWIPVKISLKFVPKGPINNIPALV